MEEPEVPLEQTHEDIHHHAQHSKQSWTMGVAMSSAILAGLAAVCSLMAGHHSNEAMLEQLQSSDRWAFFQAKGVKSSVLVSKMELMEAMGKQASAKDAEKVKEYKKEQDEIKEVAEHKEKKAEDHMHHHVILARGVTFFQVAIAVGAISVLTRRKRFWFVSLGFGAIGLFFMIQGLMAPPVALGAHSEESHPEVSIKSPASPAALPH